MNLVRMLPVVRAEANWGRWVIRCPVCSDALTLPPRTALYRCWGCGVEAEILWPANAVAIERLLSMRPLAQNRNWLPGETLHDLLAENVAHGIGPTEPGQEMMILGDEIVEDTLPAVAARLMIGA